MKKTVLWSIIAVLVIVVAVLGYSVLSREYSSPSLPDGAQNEKDQIEGENTQDKPQADTVPDYRDFTVYTYEGDTVSLSDKMSEGKPCVINFWTTWCGYCKQEMPDFNEVYKEYGDRVNFMMVDVNGGGNDNMEDARAYVEGEGFEFPVYYDTDMSAASAYGLRSFPTTVVINAEGVTVYAYPGMMEKQTLISLIETALS